MARRALAASSVASGKPATACVTMALMVSSNFAIVALKAPRVTASRCATSPRTAPRCASSNVSYATQRAIDVLHRHGLKPIDQSGVRFDPNIHEAVVTEENPSLPAHAVTAILQKGFYLHDRLLRPALVKVAVGGPE